MKTLAAAAASVVVVNQNCRFAKCWQNTRIGGGGACCCFKPFLSLISWYPASALFFYTYLLTYLYLPSYQLSYLGKVNREKWSENTGIVKKGRERF